MKIREGLKAYNKTNPMSYEDFSDVITWWANKIENTNAWKVSVKILKDYNLDIKNPNDVEEIFDLSPHEVIDTILKDEEKTLQLLKEIRELIHKEIPK